MITPSPQPSIPRRGSSQAAFAGELDFFDVLPLNGGRVMVVGPPVARKIIGFSRSTSALGWGAQPADRGGR
jgi:hypothetical protein